MMIIKQTGLNKPEISLKVENMTENFNILANRSV